MELSSYKLDYMEDFFRNRPTLTPHEENLEFFYYPWTFKSVLIDELEPIPNKEQFLVWNCSQFVVFLGCIAQRL